MLTSQFPNSTIKTLLLASVLVLSGCAVKPPYPFAKDEKKAAVRLLDTGSVTMCKDGSLYSLPAAQDAQVVHVPAGERITLSTYLYFDGYQVYHTCYPSLSFIPLEGETYVLHDYLGMNVCRLELVRADQTKPTGVSLERSVGPRNCVKDNGK